MQSVAATKTLPCKHFQSAADRRSRWGGRLIRATAYGWLSSAVGQEVNGQSKRVGKVVLPTVVPGVEVRPRQPPSLWHEPTHDRQTESACTGARFRRCNRLQRINTAGGRAVRLAVRSAPPRAKSSARAGAGGVTEVREALRRPRCNSGRPRRHAAAPAVHRPRRAGDIRRVVRGEKGHSRRDFPGLGRRARAALRRAAASSQVPWSGRRRRHGERRIPYLANSCAITWVSGTRPPFAAEYAGNAPNSRHTMEPRWTTDAEPAARREGRNTFVQTTDRAGLCGCSSPRAE